MAVRKLKNGKWQADVVVGKRWDGKPDRRTECHDTRTQARKAEIRLLLMKERGRNRISGRISFRDFVEEVYWPQKERLRANSRQGYERDIRLRLMPAFGDIDVEQIDRFAIQRMISACPTRKTAQNARGTLSSILSLALEMGMIAVNPAGFRYQYPEGRQRPEDYEGDWLTTFAEHRRLLEHVAANHPGEDVERIVVLGLCLGLRKGEIMGADWEDVDLEAAELHVRRTYTRGKGGAHVTPPKTPKAVRSVTIMPYALERMRAWEPGEGPIVAGSAGRRMSPETGQKRVRALVAERYADGEPLPRVTMATLRHSFATACVNGGMEISKLSAIMGHRDVKTTMRYYVRQKSADLHAAVAALDFGENANNANGGGVSAG